MATAVFYSGVLKALVHRSQQGWWRRWMAAQRGLHLVVADGNQCHNVHLVNPLINQSCYLQQWPIFKKQQPPFKGALQTPKSPNQPSQPANQCPEHKHQLQTRTNLLQSDVAYRLLGWLKKKSKKFTWFPLILQKKLKAKKEHILWWLYLKYIFTIINIIKEIWSWISKFSLVSLKIKKKLSKFREELLN